MVVGGWQAHVNVTRMFGSMSGSISDDREGRGIREGNGRNSSSPKTRSLDVHGFPLLEPVPQRRDHRGVADQVLQGAVK